MIIRAVRLAFAVFLIVVLTPLWVGMLLCTPKYRRLRYFPEDE